MLIIGAGIHKILVRIANREEPDQKQSDLFLHCLAGNLVFEILEDLPY